MKKYLLAILAITAAIPTQAGSSISTKNLSIECGTQSVIDVGGYFRSNDNTVVARVGDRHPILANNPMGEATIEKNLDGTYLLKSEALAITPDWSSDYWDRLEITLDLKAKKISYKFTIGYNDQVYSEGNFTCSAIYLNNKLQKAINQL